MSYCRWSDDDFKCDVYCYEDLSGMWITCVAGKRLDFTGAELPPPVVYSDDPEGWARRRSEVTNIVKTLPLAEIDLPRAGSVMRDPAPAEAAGTLETLREIGYNVPQYAIDALREEADECTS